MGMSIASSSAGASSVGGAAKWQEQRQNFNALSQALKSGDLGGAQKAFSSLSANSPAAADPNSPLAKLGKALQSGDISAAQQSFSSLRGAGQRRDADGDNDGSTARASAPRLASSGTLGTNINTQA